MNEREYHCYVCARRVIVTAEWLYSRWGDEEFPSSVKCAGCSGDFVRCFYPPDHPVHANLFPDE